MKAALTIAGSDPTGGAGLQADLKVFRAFGVHGLSVTSALTAQNTEGVSAIIPVDKGFFIGQMDVLLSDIRPDALKTGMLYSAWAVDVIADRIEEYSLKNLVIDPVTISSTGVPLVEQETLEAVKEQLFPLASVITPNIYEASVLTGINVENVSDMEEAAKRLKEMGPAVVIITGGHFEEVRSQSPSATRRGGKSVSFGDPPRREVRSDEETLDLIYDGTEFYCLKGKRIEGEFHGTGCAFSAAITASLASGHSALESARKAKAFINNAIRKAYHLGKGMRLLNL
ncbi:MAG: bifunctional hydroxymethylpyrimidine kinase/phosphomethylpyrimidine kinase [Thermodesulfovibrionales bacterium]|nr:bifunctional hydroxymethylpyrimidine kinase/phosphomethylpyrimidine kinase [Thermodesulfovibrionales bacterium]